MSRKSKLTESQKELIAKSYLAGNTQQKLADLYDVARSTIQSVLVEKNIIPPMGMGAKLKRDGYKTFTSDQQEILAFCKKYNLNSTQLEAIVQAPSLTGKNMINVFARMNSSQKLNFLQAARAVELQLKKEEGSNNDGDLKTG